MTNINDRRLQDLASTIDYCIRELNAVRIRLNTAAIAIKLSRSLLADLANNNTPTDTASTNTTEVVDDGYYKPSLFDANPVTGDNQLGQA